MSTEQNINLVRRVFEAFNTGDTSTVHEGQRTHIDPNLEDLRRL